jgi:hypothetical protein
MQKPRRGYKSDRTQRGPGRRTDPAREETDRPGIVPGRLEVNQPRP